MKQKTTEDIIVDFAHTYTYTRTHIYMPHMCTHTHTQRDLGQGPRICILNKLQGEIDVTENQRSKYYSDQNLTEDRRVLDSI